MFRFAWASRPSRKFIGRVPRLEVLEDRTTPAIVFANYGQPSDTFTPAEHAVIARAIQLWQDRLTIPQTLSITFLKEQISSDGEIGGVTEQTAHQAPQLDSNGQPIAGTAVPTAATIVLDPNTPAGTSLFVDATPESNPEFTPVAPFVYQFPTSYGIDMLSTTLHEIGHALGIGTTAYQNLGYGGAGYYQPIPNAYNLLYTGSDGFQAVFTADGAHLDPNDYPNDLMTPTASPGIRSLPSDTDVHVLIDTYPSYRLTELPYQPPNAAQAYYNLDVAAQVAAFAGGSAAQYYSAYALMEAQAAVQALTPQDASSDWYLAYLDAGAAQYYALQDAESGNPYSPYAATPAAAGQALAYSNAVYLNTHPDVLQDLQAVSISPPSIVSGTSVTYTYAVNYNPLTANTSAALYWASGPSVSNLVSGPIDGTVTALPAGTPVGTSTVNVPGSALSNPPAGATNLLLIVNPDGQVPEVNAANNVAVAQLVVFPVTF